MVSLIMLTILTLLGVTAMTTTSLEEKMAANIQEASRALQVAETGIILAFEDVLTWDIDGYTPAVQPPDISDASGTVTATTTYASSFNGWGNVPLGSKYSSKSFRSAHFDFQVTGARGSVGTVILHGGAYLLAPKL